MRRTRQLNTGCAAAPRWKTNASVQRGSSFLTTSSKEFEDIEIIFGVNALGKGLLKKGQLLKNKTGDHNGRQISDLKGTIFDDELLSLP